MTQTLNNACWRWMLRRDLPQVVDIEAASFPPGADRWEEEDFVFMLRHRHTGCFVLEDNTSAKILGYYTVISTPKLIEVENIVIHPAWRRLGYGTTAMQRLQKSARCHNKTLILRVHEQNLTAQLFLRACGVRAHALLRRYCGPHDAIEFSWE